MQYGSFEDAKEKWEEMVTRVDFKNLYVIMESRKCNQGLLEQFSLLAFPNKVVITDGPHPEIPCSFPIYGDFYGEEYFNGKLLTYSKKGQRRYMDVFDYVAFFNKGIIRRRSLF